MKSPNISCKGHVMPSKDGSTKCHCKFLNRQWNKEYKVYTMFMKNLKKPSGK